MEDQQGMQDCGCHCDMCMKGDHEHCETGTCQKKMAPAEEA